MELDKMLFARLAHDAGLAELLTVFGGRPAVFYQRAQSPDHPKWADKEKQYPRIDYTIDFQGDPARQTSGRLMLNIWCDTHFGAEPEDIEACVRVLLHASFAQTDDYPYCLAWLRSDAFEIREEGKTEIRTIGITMLFDIIAFPPQTTLYPDPIKAMNEWTKAVCPTAIVIGIDTFEGWYTPTRESPVVYWRLAARAIHEQHHVHTWMNISMEGHVYALYADDRLLTLVKLNTAAALANHVKMEDTSPLFLREFNVRPHLNFLAPGQIQVNARFGLLQPSYINPPPVDPLDDVHMHQTDDKE